MASQDVTAFLTTAGGKFDKLKTDEAAVAAAEQQNGLPALRSTVVSDKSDIEAYVVAQLGISMQTAVFLTNALSPDQAKTTLGEIVTAVAALQAK